MLEFRLLGYRIESRQGQRIDPQSAHETCAPMHRQETLPRTQALAGFDRHHHVAAPAFHAHQIAWVQSAQFHVARCHRQQRRVGMSEQARDAAGAAHRVPLVAQAAGIEVQGIARVDRLGHRTIRYGMKVRPSAGGGIDAVSIQARLARGRALGKRPLLRRLIQQRIGQARDVEIAPARGLAMFVEHGFGAVVGKQPRALARHQPVCKFSCDDPVGAGLARRRYRRMHARNAAFGIGHGSILLAPAGGRQQHVGKGHGLGIGKRLLHHHAFGRLQGVMDQTLVGHRLCGVGTGDPDRLDLAAAHGLEHFHRGLARRRRYRIHPPQPRDLGAVLGVGKIAVRGQQIGEPADLAPAHRVGLAGERQRRGARLADLARGQVQIDQRGILVDTAARLVQALAIQRQRRPGGEPARRLHDVGRRHAADRRHFFRRVVAHLVAQRLPALGVRGNGVAVDQRLPQHHVEHGVIQRDVGTGQDREMQVGLSRGVGAARIDHDQLQVRVGLARRLDAAEQDRVRIGRVRSGDENRPGVIDVVVAAWRRIGTQRDLVARHRGRHAQARIGVDVVGADQPLGKLVEDVIRLGGELAGNIERHRIGAVFLDDRTEFLGDMVERRVPAHALARRGPVGPQFGIQRTPARRRRQGERRALGAELAAVRRMRGVAAHAGDLPGVGLDQHPATGAAITADR